MSKYLVEDTSLTSVANAIRTKGGTAAQLEFPDDFVSAIQAIPSVKTQTGTFTGNGTRQVTVSCPFEPDLVYWDSDPGTSASSGTVSCTIARGMMAANRYRNNATTNSNYILTPITGMNTDGSSYSFRATYSDGTVTLYSFSSNARNLFTNNRTYSYTFVKWTT